MSKLLGISFAATIALVVMGSAAFAGHRWGCSTPRYYYYPHQYQYQHPGYQRPVAPAPGTPAPGTPAPAPGAQPYRGFSYEPGAEGTDAQAPSAPMVSPGYQPTYTPRPAARPSRPSYLDATSKMRGRFGR